MTKEKRSTLDEIEKMVTDPDVDYTTTPINVMKFIEFMNLAGTVKKKPRSWNGFVLPDRVRGWRGVRV
jgi:NitT/TauT family transport system substrate-binding protein